MIKMDIQSITVIDKERQQGISASFVIENGKIAGKHIEKLEPSDWGEEKNDR